MTEQHQDAPENGAEAVEADVVDHEAHEAVEPPTDAPDAPPQPVKNWSDSDEEEARLFGWKSPDEWKGEKPAGYIDDPQEFLGRVQRSRVFQTMQEKMDEQARKLAAVNDMALRQQQADYEAKLRSITARQRQAVEEADTGAWDALERQKAELMKNAPGREPEQPETPQAPPEVSQYREANPWAKDPVLWAEAVQAVNAGLNTGAITSNDPRAQLEFAERAVRTKYPHLFEQPKPKQQAQRVDPGGLAPAARSGRSEFDKLPNDAKEAFKRFVSRKVYNDDKESRERYAREYNAS